MINRFQYSVGVPAEDITQYSAGGYHPVHLKDHLNGGRYEILQKLGFGSFSTVWLARDNQSETYVSIKIVIASQSGPDNRELKILQHIKDHGDSQHPGHKHVSQLLDSFYHEGANGRHLCVVMEPLGPRASEVAERCKHYRLDSNLARRVSRQLLLAVDFLHSCGVAHGDIHMGNVLFRLPDSGQSPSETYFSSFGDPQIGEVARRDGSPLEKGLPEYLVDPIRYDMNHTENFKEVQLVDFGEAFLISEPPDLIFTPLSLHPPELVFRRALTEAVDMWNLGSTTFELVTGRPPFEASFNSDQPLVAQFQKVLGGVPEQWILDAVRTGVLDKMPDESEAEGFLLLEDDITRSYFGSYDPDTLQLDQASLTILGRYLRKLLVVDPAERQTPKGVLVDPWVSTIEEVVNNVDVGNEE